MDFCEKYHRNDCVNILSLLCTDYIYRDGLIMTEIVLVK